MFRPDDIMGLFSNIGPDGLRSGGPNGGPPRVAMGMGGGGGGYNERESARHRRDPTWLTWDSSSRLWWSASSPAILTFFGCESRVGPVKYGGGRRSMSIWQQEVIDYTVMIPAARESKM